MVLQGCSLPVAAQTLPGAADAITLASPNRHHPSLASPPPTLHPEFHSPQD